MNPRLANDAGIALGNAERIGEFALEGHKCTGLKKNVSCLIVWGNENEIELPSIPVIFTDPWPVKRENPSD